MSVLVILEQRSGKWNRASFEAVAAAKSIGQEIHAVVIGSDVEAMAQDAAGYGVAKVFVIDDPALAEYTPDGWTDGLEQLMRSSNPDTVVFPHTYQVRDFAPKLAARFGHFLISDVVEVKPDGTMVRQLFQGKLNAGVKGTKAPVFVSIQAGAFRAAEKTSATAPLERFQAAIDLSKIRSKPEPPFREAQRSVDLSAADSIVAVGRGIKEKENLGLVQQLADALGAELAASRPICDNGWLPMERQVGSSGQTVAPKVYFAIGISGAIQHLVGMKGSKTVVAINRDESAPIFETADYGIIGDLFEVLPALVTEIQKVKSGQ